MKLASFFLKIEAETTEKLSKTFSILGLAL